MTSTRIALIAVTVFVLDQVTKIAVIKNLSLHRSVRLLPFFSLTHVQNTGAAFGIYPGGNMFFVIVTLAILAVLVLLHKHLVQGKLSAAGVGLLWGGAVGNLADRLFRGSVTDFLDFFWKGWHWPAFNTADSAICVGTFLLVVAGFFPQKSGMGDRGQGMESEHPSHSPPPNP